MPISMPVISWAPERLCQKEKTVETAVELVIQRELMSTLSGVDQRWMIFSGEICRLARSASNSS